MSISFVDWNTIRITKFIDNAGNEAYIQLFDSVGWLVLINPSLDYKIQFYP